MIYPVGWLDYLDNTQGYAGNYLTTGSPGEIKVNFAVFSNFYGVNPPTMDDFNLPKWLHWTQNWEKLNISDL